MGSILEFPKARRGELKHTCRPGKGRDIFCNHLLLSRLCFDFSFIRNIFKLLLCNIYGSARQCTKKALLELLLINYRILIVNLVAIVLFFSRIFDL